MTKRQLVGLACRNEAGKSQAKMGDAMQLVDRLFDEMDALYIMNSEAGDKLIKDMWAQARKRNINKFFNNQKQWRESCSKKK